MIKNYLLLILGFIVNIMLPPLVVSVITYTIFEQSGWSFYQIYWVTGIWWLSLMYITINLQNTIKEGLGE